MPDVDLPGLVVRHLTAIRHDVPRVLLSERLAFVYEAESPLAVRLLFPLDRVWAFDRGLLVRGLVEPAGHGDVRVRPYSDEVFRDRVEIHLNNGKREARLLFERAALQACVDASARCVPIGAEQIDRDELAARLYIGGGR